MTVMERKADVIYFVRLNLMENQTQDSKENMRQRHSFMFARSREGAFVHVREIFLRYIPIGTTISTNVAFEPRSNDKPENGLQWNPLLTTKH